MQQLQYTHAAKKLPVSLLFLCSRTRCRLPVPIAEKFRALIRTQPWRKNLEINPREFRRDARSRATRRGGVEDGELNQLPLRTFACNFLPCRRCCDKMVIGSVFTV